MLLESGENVDQRDQVLVIFSLCNFILFSRTSCVRFAYGFSNSFLVLAVKDWGFAKVSVRSGLRGWGEELETRAYTKACDIGLSRQVSLASSRNTRQAEEEDGKALCDKRDRAIAYVFCREFLSSLNIYVFWSFTKRSVQRKVKFGEVISNKIIVMLVTHGLPSCCVSSPILSQTTWHLWTDVSFKTQWLLIVSANLDSLSFSVYIERGTKHISRKDFIKTGN